MVVLTVRLLRNVGILATEEEEEEALACAGSAEAPEEGGAPSRRESAETPAFDSLSSRES